MSASHDSVRQESGQPERVPSGSSPHCPLSDFLQYLAVAIPITAGLWALCAWLVGELPGGGLP